MQTTIELPKDNTEAIVLLVAGLICLVVLTIPLIIENKKQNKKLKNKT